MISIVTATYNRKKELKNLYNSLKKNIIPGMEWLIIDDGSTDDTYKEVEKWTKEKLFKIIYRYQDNMGKMKAINNYMDLASNPYVVEIDSDDVLKPNSLRDALYIMDHSNLKDIYAYAFLKEINGKINLLPLLNKPVKMFDIYNKYNYKGDLLLIFKTSIRKKYKYDLEPGEKFITEGYFFNELDRNYKGIGLDNRIVLECTYQDDGYSKNIDKIFFKYPKGYLKYYKDCLLMDLKGIKFKNYLSLLKNYLFFIYINKEKLSDALDGLNFKERFLLRTLYLPGLIKYKKKYRKVKNILVTAYSLDLGGIEISLINFLKEFSKTYNITLVLEKKEGVLLNKVPKNINIIEYKINNDNFILKRKLINFVKYLKFKIKYSKEFDVGVSYATYSRPGSKLARIIPNNILFIHGNYKDIYKDDLNSFYKFYKDIKVSKFKKIIFVSKKSMRDQVDLYPSIKNKSYVINNLVDYDKIIGSSKEKLDDSFINKIKEDKEKGYTIFLNVSRHEEKAKKISRIIDALSKLKKDKIKAKCIFVGDGESNLEYKKLVKNKKLDKYVYFVGSKVNPYPYFKLCDAVLLSSIYEGYPVIYLESMILNKPIITTKVSDYEDIENKYGIVTPNSSKGIYEGVKSFINKPFVIKNKFDPEKYNEEVRNKLKDIINK